MACAFAGSVATFLAGRLIQASGAAAGAIIGRAMVRDVHGPEGSASTLGYAVMSATVASGLAPVAGALVDQWAGWRAILVLLALFGTLLLAVCHLTRDETSQARARAAQPWAHDLFHLALTRRFVGPALYASFLFVSWFESYDHVAAGGRGGIQRQEGKIPSFVAAD